VLVAHRSGWRAMRMYVQQCFGLSDEGIEDAIYDSQAIRSFVGIDLGRKTEL
jgi:IS5 family transposase